MNFAAVTAISLASLVGVALTERAAFDLPHQRSATPAFVDAKGRTACTPGYVQYRGWCNIDLRVWSEKFQYPMSEYVPPEAVSAQWNAAGSAVCPGGYDYFAREGYCLPTALARDYLGDYPVGQYFPPITAGVKWNEASAPVCPNGFDYVPHEGLCLVTAQR